ncbi:dual-specificity RNA methyltransferase RlmN [Viscerimonas tarda]
MSEKTPLLGMSLDELKLVAGECGLPAFAAKQMADWLYKKRVTSIEQMTNVSAANRALLAGKYDIGRSEPVESQTAKDGTVKYLFRTGSGKLIESVMIPDENRMTLCVSSQAGCKLNCLFCMTGKQGFSGNLSANDILNQIFSIKESDELTNVVFMGMGEPLDNYEQLAKSLEILTAAYGLAWSPKRITVSTTGILPKLQLFLEESNAHLAISLHNPFPEERLSIMPVEKSYPLVEILDLLRQYDWSKQRRLSFEYIMFDGVNDSAPYSKELARLLKGLECRINLIRFHAIPGVDLRSSNRENMEQFRDYLTSKGIMCSIRASRGEDISAACGMLSTEKGKEKKIHN